MAYFTQEFIDYFRQLSRNNERDWFHAHKKEYERHVKQPFNAFVAEIIDRISLKDPEVEIEPKDAVFRIARDIRFSKDKTPYKTHMAAVITREGKRNVQYPGLYFYFGAKSLGIGGGVYKLDKDHVQKIRRTIAQDGKSLERATKGKAFVELFGELQGEKNVRLPKEFADAAERFPLIANKQFYYFAEYDDPKILLRNDLPSFVMRHYRAGQKVNDFLKTAVG
jgi:uncharacterized protein (TIGR02453 family)